MKKIILYLTLSVILLSSCKKNTDTNNSAEPVVYVAGHQWDSVAGNDRSTVWKNGVPSTNQVSGSLNHYANAIAVSGADVYTTGYENQPAQWKCLVWKNGTLQSSLGTGYSYGNGIAVSGTDIYVTGGGYIQTPLTYSSMLWKNQSGPATTLASNSSGAVGNDIVISGTDVYVGGNENNSGRIWKNGVAQTLNNASGFPISCIAVSGNNVYGAASNGSIIRTWKNEIPTDINIPAGSSAFVTGIAINENDVYLCGWEFNGSIGIAKFWKNGVPVTLGDGIQSSRANGIAIKNNIVYIVGDVIKSGTVSDFATLWKNGTPATIGFKNSRATAITVK